MIHIDLRVVLQSHWLKDQNWNNIYERIVVVSQMIKLNEGA